VAAADVEWVRQISCETLMGGRGDAHLSPAPGQGPNGEEAVTWEIAASQGEQITLDLAALGIDPAQFDELAVNFLLEGSDTMPRFSLYEWPRSETMSNWYAKIRRPLNEWLDWRCDLRMDDDGVFLSDDYAKGTEKFTAPTLRLALVPRFLRIADEPPWRRVRLANVRLVRHPLRISFDKRDAICVVADGLVITSYQVTVENRMTTPGTASISADIRDLKFFSAEFSESSRPAIELNLAAGEQRNLTLRLMIPLAQAEKLASLYAEPVSLSGRMQEVPEVEVRPIMGYRPWRLWAAVPVWQPHYPVPAETIAATRELGKIYPWLVEATDAVVQRGRQLLGEEFPVLTMGPPGHDQNYICQKCGIRPKPLEVTRHQCPKCGEIITDTKVIAAYLPIRHGANFAAAEALAEAYQQTGDEAFAAKALGILREYADKYEQIINYEPRSTATQGHLGRGTLMESFLVTGAFRAYRNLRSSSSLTAADRQHIERDFLLNSAVRLARHGAEANQRIEHGKIAIYGGLLGGNWALAGEAVYGPNGWLALLDDGFSADGVAQEGGVYHAGQLGALAEAANELLANGVNLYNARFKRVFDASVAVSPVGISPYCADKFETAYRIWRDPLYLPTVHKYRERPSWTTVREGVIGLPSASATLDRHTLLAHSGYLFLRQRTAAGHRCLAINSGMQWERSELDRLHFRLFVDGEAVSRQIGRITYGSDYSHNMYPSFAHNVVTVDGKDLLEERVTLVAVIEQPGLTAALYRTDHERPLYPGVSQYRLVAIVDGHFLVVDRLESVTPHAYAWHFYPAASRQQCSLPLVSGEGVPPEIHALSLPEGSTGPWATGWAEGPFSVGYSDPDNPRLALTMRVLTDGPAEVLNGTIMQHYYPKLHPFTRVRRKDTTMASFAALFICGEAKDKELGKIEPYAAVPSGVFAWRITTADHEYILGINATGRSVAVAGRDAREALIAVDLCGDQKGNNNDH